MKELSIEEKAKAYDEKLDVARHIYADPSVKDEDKYYIEVIFPEIAESEESEDERIRKDIIATIHLYYGEPLEDEAKEMIAWLEKQANHANFCNKIQIGDKVTRNRDGVLVNLSQLNRIAKKDEKQGEQKPADKVEPKFKVGEWITNGEFTWYIKKVGNGFYDLKSPDGRVVDDTISHVDEHFHLWTIQDAKDGDVLISDFHFIFIFKEIKNNTYISHCSIIDRGNDVIINSMAEREVGDVNIVKCQPATKVQRDILFQKIEESGYKWDAEKKELKKIGQNPQCIVSVEAKEAVLNEKQEEQVSEEFINALGTMLNDGLPDRYLVSEERIKKSAELLFSIAREQLKNEMQEWGEEDEHLSVVRTKELIRAEIQKQKQNLIDSIGRTSNKELNLAHHILCVLESFINTIPEKSIEWTEDDENKVTLFMQLVEGCDNYEELSNWLKSLRPQNRWKPSDEQMGALDDVISSRDIKYDVLSELWKDLKKLMKE